MLCCCCASVIVWQFTQARAMSGVLCYVLLVFAGVTLYHALVVLSHCNRFCSHTRISCRVHSLNGTL